MSVLSSGPPSNSASVSHALASPPSNLSFSAFPKSSWATPKRPLEAVALILFRACVMHRRGCSRTQATEAGHSRGWARRIWKAERGMGGLWMRFVRGAAGRGLEKLSRGLEKILDVGLNFKNGICPAHSRPDVELEKLGSLCEAYAKIIKQDHKIIHIWSLRSELSICAASIEHKETLMNDESINAENQANEITDWLNDLNVRQWELQFAYAAHILKRNSARSRFVQCKCWKRWEKWWCKSRADLTKITWAIACEWACHKLSSWFTCFVHMLSICRRIFARLAAKSIHDICMICDCAVFSMFRSSRAYAQLQYFALAVSLLATTLAK